LPIKNLTLGAVTLLAGVALAQNHHNTKITHVVKRGETLEKIAKWTGTSKKRLITANNLYSKKFKPGLILYIPAAAKSAPKHYDLHASGYAPYTIRKNDSDWKIANMFHMTPSAVRVLNPRVAWSSPKAGTQIKIPMKNAFIYKLARVPVIRTRYAVTLRPETVVRTQPGSNAKRVAKVDAGRHVRVLDRSDHWYKVKFEHGTTGWVRGDLLAGEQPKVVAYHAPAKHSRSSHSATARLASYTPSRRSGRSSRNTPRYAANLPSTGNNILDFARSMAGTPYRYGAASRSGTDCSGFALQVMRQGGVKMPRTAAEQSRKGQKVSGGDLKAGDLVFFHPSRGSRISHVGIYMGNGKFIHASSGGGKVQVNSLNDKYYKKNFATARRVVKVKTSSNKADVVAQSHREDVDAMKAAEKTIKTTTKVTDAVGN
jgi:cell wall-associated NlpC family hydrolase